MALQIEPVALEILNKVNQFLERRQIEAYLVGGFVRDMLIGRATADIDIAISGDALFIAQEMAVALGGKYVLLDEVNCIARVVFVNQVPIPLSAFSAGGETRELKQWYVDLSAIAGNIQQDLARRDFTIDAMAIELKTFMLNPGLFKIIDPFKGQEDINRNLIQAVDRKAFESDPARLLRAVRLAAELGFTISAETKALVHRDAALIKRIAGERVREELLRILAVPEAGRFIRYLDEVGLLTAVIPELEPARGVEQPKEHHWDVLNHSLETVLAVDFLLRQGKWEYTSNEVLDFVPWSEKFKEHFNADVSNGSTRSSILKLAALLHDISKPETKIIANDRVRFFGHTERGGAVSAGLMERLRFSNKEIKLVELMVRYHLRPTQMSHEGMPTQRAIYRYFRDTGSAGIDILFLSLADHLAARGPELDLEQWKWHAGQVNCILTDCFQRQAVITPPKLIDGHDLIGLFGMKPGPEIREILEAVKEAQAAGELMSREEALSYIKNRLLYRKQN